MSHTLEKVAHHQRRSKLDTINRKNKQSFFFKTKIETKYFNMFSLIFIYYEKIIKTLIMLVFMNA